MGVVVGHDGCHGKFQPRHVPKCRGSEDEGALTRPVHDLPVGTHQHDTRCRAEAAPEKRSLVMRQLAPTERVTREAVLDFHPPAIVDDDGIVVRPPRGNKRPARPIR